MESIGDPISLILSREFPRLFSERKKERFTQSNYAITNRSLKSIYRFKRTDTLGKTLESHLPLKKQSPHHLSLKNTKDAI